MSDILADFMIVFSDSRASFSEGDKISGEVVVDLKEDIVIEKLNLEFFGTAVAQWVKTSGFHLGRSSRTDGPGYDEEKCLNQKISLYSRANKNTPELMVSAGRHAYPFSVQLPYHLPSTFTGDHGSIKYMATATLIRPWQARQTTSKEFTITSVVDLNALPQAMHPIQCVKRQERGIMCCGGGNVEAIWRLDKMGFVPGEIIRINGEIHNNSRTKVNKSSASLIQHIRYYDGWGESQHERKQVALVTRGETLPGHITFWREEMEVPPLPPTGLKGCNLMDLWYTLKLKVIPVGFAQRIEGSTDIIIATVPRDGNGVPAHFTAYSPFPAAQAHVSVHDISPGSNPSADPVGLDLNYFI